MSGGVAYVYDEDGQFAKRANLAQVSLDKVLPAAEQLDAGIPQHKGQVDEAMLKKLIEDHHRWTGSLRAREILDTWSASLNKFVKVFPTEYRRALTEMGAKQETTATITKAKGDESKAKSGKAKA